MRAKTTPRFPSIFLTQFPLDPPPPPQNSCCSVHLFYPPSPRSVLSHVENIMSRLRRGRTNISGKRWVVWGGVYLVKMALARWLLQRASGPLVCSSHRAAGIGIFSRQTGSRAAWVRVRVRRPRAARLQAGCPAGSWRLRACSGCSSGIFGSAMSPSLPLHLQPIFE